MKYYRLYEIGYDISIESEETLIRVANEHCKSYPEREHLLPIDTIQKAKDYFNQHAFMVTEMHASEGVCPICRSEDIDYGCAEVDFPDGVHQQCTCNNCGADFDEWYDLSFSGQWNIETNEFDETIESLVPLKKGNK